MMRRTSTPNTPVPKEMKIALIGHGKKEIQEALAPYSFDFSYVTTIGVTFSTETVDVDGTLVKFHLWGHGQERERAITRAFYRDAHVLWFCYYPEGGHSLEEMRLWLEQTQRDVPEWHTSKKYFVRVIKSEDSKEIVVNAEAEQAENQLLASYDIRLTWTINLQDPSTIRKLLTQIARNTIYKIESEALVAPLYHRSMQREIPSQAPPAYSEFPDNDTAGNSRGFTQ